MTDGNGERVLDEQRRTQAAERIALAIARAIAYRRQQGGSFTLADARRVNAERGWSFDIRWQHGDEESRRLTQERGWRLEGEELQRAYTRARAKLEGA